MKKQVKELLYAEIIAVVAGQSDNILMVLKIGEVMEQYIKTLLIVVEQYCDDDGIKKSFYTKELSLSNSKSFLTCGTEVAEAFQKEHGNLCYINVTDSELYRKLSNEYNNSCCDINIVLSMKDKCYDAKLQEEVIAYFFEQGYREGAYGKNWGSW